MDRDDLGTPDGQQVVAELNELVGDLRRRGLRVSSWYGKFEISNDAFQETNRGYGYAPLPEAADDANFPWFLYWEIAWIVMNNDFRAGDRLLDLGGSSSLFSYYMASKGLEVVTVDLQSDLVKNANDVAAKAGWQLSNHVMDMRELAFAEPFDHIASVCVFEHLPLSSRVDVTGKVREMLKAGGSFSITFDYLNPIGSARISSPAAVHQQFVAPSGLRLRGNQEFQDNGKRYLLQPFYHRRAWVKGWKPKLVLQREFPLGDLFRTKRENDYTFGALFMEK